MYAPLLLIVTLSFTKYKFYWDDNKRYLIFLSFASLLLQHQKSHCLANEAIMIVSGTSARCH